jgi:hypothetical protein
MMAMPWRFAAMGSVIATGWPSIRISPPGSAW